MEGSEAACAIECIHAGCGAKAAQELHANADMSLRIGGTAPHQETKSHSWHCHDVQGILERGNEAFLPRYQRMASPEPKFLLLRCP